MPMVHLIRIVILTSRFKNIPENETRDFRIKLKKALWLKFGKMNYSFDILVDNEQRIQKRIEMGDLFYKEIYSKGKLFYA